MIMKRYYTFFVFNLFLFDFTECGLLIPFEHFQNTVEIDIELTNQGILFLNLVLGNPPQYFSFFLSTILQKTYITKFPAFEEGFSPINSTSFVEEKKIVDFPFAGYNLKGKYCNDFLFINREFNINNYPFVLIHEGTLTYQNKGSMGFEFLSNGREESYYSFIERIKALKKLINQFFI